MEPWKTREREPGRVMFPLGWLIKRIVAAVRDYVRRTR